MSTTIRISFLVLTAIWFTSFTSCKKDQNNPVNNPSATTSGDTVAIWTLIDQSSGALFNQITDIEQRGTGNIWISSFNGGFASKISSFGIGLNNVSILDSTTTDFLKSKVTSIGFNSAFNLHIGTLLNNSSGMSKEIIVEAGGVYLSYTSPGGLGYNFENFYFNSSGLWYGTGNTGLVNFDNPNFTVYDEANSNIPYPGYVRDIIQINSQDFWLSTASEIIKKTGNSYDVVFNNVYSQAMDQDSQGNLWLAGYQSRFYKYDGVDTTEYLIPTIPNMDVSDLVCDKFDNIWIATNGILGGDGLFKFDGSTWTHYTTANSSLHSMNLSKLFVDSFGNLWIGSADAGVMRLNKFGTQN